MTDIQLRLYRHFLKSKAMRMLMDGRQSRVLSSITALKKLCNHPKLIYDAVYVPSCGVESPAVLNTCV